MPSQLTLTISRGSVGNHTAHQRPVQATVGCIVGDKDERTIQCFVVGKIACVQILRRGRAERIREGSVMSVVHGGERGDA